MAVQADVTIPGGLVVESAYVVIEYISYIKRRVVGGETPSNDLSAIAYCYSSQAASADPALRLYRIDILKPIDQEEPIMSQLYDALKEASEISNAADV